MLCAIHNLEMKQIPAGISKRTGQPYNAFLSCPNRDCKWKPGQNPNYPENSPQAPYAPKPIPQPTYAPEPFKENREEYGRRLAIHGMVNGMLAAGASPQAIIGQLPSLIMLEDAINEALEGRFADPIDVSEIPY